MMRFATPRSRVIVQICCIAPFGRCRRLPCGKYQAPVADGGTEARFFGILEGSLDTAVALLAHEQRNGFGAEALQGLARVCVQSLAVAHEGLARVEDWHPQQLAGLAHAFALAELPHEGLLKEIGVVAAKRHLLGDWRVPGALSLRLSLLLRLLPLLSLAWRCCSYNFL